MCVCFLESRFAGVYERLYALDNPGQRKACDVIRLLRLTLERHGGTHVGSTVTGAKPNLERIPFELSSDFFHIVFSVLGPKIEPFS